MTAVPKREGWIGTRGALLLAIGSWVVFGALTVGLGFSLRDGGVVADGTDLSGRIATAGLIQSAGILAAAFFACHLALRWVAPRADPILLPVVAALCSIGWVFLASVGPDLAAYKGKPGLAGMGSNHLQWTIIGLVACLVVAGMSQRGLLRRLARLKYLMAGVYLVLVIANGFGETRELGAKVIRIGSIDIQAIEIAKYFFMFFAAGYLAEEAEWIRAGDRIRWHVVAPWLVVVAVGMAPLVWPLKEVGPTALVGLATLTLLYAGTRSLALVGGLSLVGLLGGLASYAVGVPSVVTQRVDAFIQPFGHNEQLAHGLWAIAGGGLSGTGLTSSSSYRVPIIESDYAMAGWVEMTGFAGGAVLLLLYALLCWRGLEAARWAKDPFEGFLALGLTAVLAAQIVMIVAGTMAFAPLTGITVPFVSHGGISLVTNFVAVGALLSISTRPGERPDPIRARPLRWVGAAWALMFGLLVVGLFVRSVSGADAVTERDFVNEGRQVRLQRAVDAGAVTVNDAGELVFDAEIAGQRRVRGDLKRQLDAGTVERRDGALVVASGCCVVRNPRVSSSAAAVLRGRILDRSGVPIAESVAVPGTRRQARLYPYGAALFDVTGIHDPLLVASTGAETLFDDVLRGEVKGDARRGMTRLVARRDTGDDVQLTVDAGLSQQLYALLGTPDDGGITTTGRGAVVVMEARSGDVLAAVSRPAWDPNTWEIRPTEDGLKEWVSTADPKAWEAAGYDRVEHPRVSRALATRFPPGSTFKLVVGSAWLESGRDADHQIRCRFKQPAGEHLPGCHRHPAHPNPDLREAVAESCNAWFSTAGIELGPETIAPARSLGFGRSFDLAALPDRSWPTLPSVAYEMDGPDGRVDWDARMFSRNPKKAARSAIGQDTVEATPLQMAMVAATVANRGKLVAPALVSSLRASPDPSRPGRLGAVWERAERREPVRVWEKKTADVLREGMFQVMTDGTGWRMPFVVEDASGLHSLVLRDAIPEDAEVIDVAAKSGTADVCADCDIAPHAWVVAFAPGPKGTKLVVAAMVERGGGGAAGVLALQALALGLDTLNGNGPEAVPAGPRAGSAAPATEVRP